MKISKAHAILSASGSSRWINCPKSVRLESKFPDTRSVFAEEGTLAHELAELEMLYQLKKITEKKYKSKLTKIQKHELYSVEMPHYVERYTEFVHETINQYEKPLVLIEARLDYSAWAPEGFGTGDAVIVSPKRIDVIDLKYGKGVPVFADKNTQMMLYALGAYNTFNILYDISAVNMTIVQPRLDSISTYTIDITDLLDWADSIRLVAKEAFHGQGDYQAGSHCRFCKASIFCRTHALYNLDVAKYEFEDPDLLSDKDIADILKKASTVANWLEKIEKYALATAVAGKQWPGLKLVEGRRVRTVTDKSALASELTENGYKINQIYKPRELLSMGDLEKLIGPKKFAQQYREFIYTPAGKPALVAAEDKRPALQLQKSAQDEFDDDFNFDNTEED